MTRYLSFILLGMLVYACTSKHNDNSPQAAFDLSLTRQETDSGRITAEVLFKFSRIGEPRVSPNHKLVVFTVTQYDIPTNQNRTNIFTVPAGGGEVVQLTSGNAHAWHPQWYPDGSRIGFLSDLSGSVQIWEMNIDGTGKHQISIIEGGVNSFSYAPSGDKIWYTHDVQIGKTLSELYPDLPKADVHIATDLMYRHWNHWEDYAYSHIFIATYNGKTITGGTDIMDGEPYDTPLSPYFDDSEIAWGPDGTVLAYTCKKLTGREYALSTNSDIYLYNLSDQSTTNITEGMPGYDKYPVFSPDGQKIAFISMKTPGYESDKARLMVLNRKTGQKRYMTEDFDQNVQSVSWNPDGTALYFISGIHATYQYYTMNIHTGSIRKITDGDHNYTTLALAGATLVGEKMTMSMAPELFTVDIASGKEKQITFINKPIYDHIAMGKVEKRWIKTTDNKDMLTWVIYPPGFDSTKTYPALLYCQGGPQSAVSQFWSYRWNFQMMAAHDYIIVAPNRRGLPTFGQAWNAEISGDYGGQNMKDYFSAIDAIKTEPYIDENRLGAVGASYGGFSIFWIAGHHQKRFKAFIAHCGIYNLESMYAATDETFFVNHDLGGPYWDKQNKTAQRSYATSPHKFVQNWDTPILIITGERDFRIPYTQALEAFGAARLQNIPARLLVFPDETHFVTKPQDAVLWQREFFAWLDQWLKK
ncbi:MAG: S9 family peptidase [Chlorobi bacterium]|nr:S9 family peptidase [Chlorobiota bacterium]